MRPTPNISVNVDLRNPGQFFACCGLLEIASRLWPGSEAWFENDKRPTTYCIAANTRHNDPIREVVKQVCRPNTIQEADAEHYNAGLRPLQLTHLDLRLDWWIRGGVGRSPLKLWAGQQTPIRIMTDMQIELEGIEPGQRLYSEHRFMKGRFGIDAASSWTALGLGFSPDEQNIPWPTYPGTEILGAIGLQRCKPLQIEARKGRWFSYYVWSQPMEISVLPVAAIMGKGQISEQYAFEVKMRNKQYACFDWAQLWTMEEAEPRKEDEVAEDRGG
jgi:CRISPR-associated protein Csx14